MLLGDPGDQDGLTLRVEFGGNGSDLGWSFAGAEDHFGESLTEGAMGINDGEAQFLQRSSLEVLEHLIQAGFAGTEFFKERDGLVLSHGGERCHEAGWRSKGVVE